MSDDVYTPYDEWLEAFDHAHGLDRTDAYDEAVENLKIALATRLLEKRTDG